MDEKNIQQLLLRFRANELQGDELTAWNRVIESSEGRAILQHLMEEEISQLETPGHFDLEPWKPVLARILQLDHPDATQTMIVQAPVRRLRKWLWAASAAVIVLAAGAMYLWNQPSPAISPAIVTKEQEPAPAKEGAILTLADGKQVVLDSMGNGIVALESGTQVTLKNGQLQYAQLESNRKEVVYNTMTTPRGRQFRIVLPDGTEVWLNAQSSIRFPVEFNTTERRVEVTGEAFFHVKSLELPAFNGRAAMKVPFVVNVNKQLNVEVVGTQFNVNAYTNENSINTTLTEGVVRVRNAEDPAQFVMLRPGQQASAQQPGGESIKVEDADLAKVLAWKNGLFNFENVSLADAMKQLERWYDIDVEYEKDIPQIWFTGKMNRDISLSGLLKILETTGVQFRVEGRKLVVLQSK